MAFPVRAPVNAARRRRFAACARPAPDSSASLCTTAAAHAGSASGAAHA